MRDFIAEDILRQYTDDRLNTRRDSYLGQTGRVSTRVPAANRYPRSERRSQLEAALQPWNRPRLGSGQTWAQ